MAYGAWGRRVRTCTKMIPGSSDLLGIVKVLFDVGIAIGEVGKLGNCRRLFRTHPPDGDPKRRCRRFLLLPRLLPPCRRRPAVPANEAPDEDLLPFPAQISVLHFVAELAEEMYSKAAAAAGNHFRQTGLLALAEIIDVEGDALETDQQFQDVINHRQGHGDLFTLTGPIFILNDVGEDLFDNEFGLSGDVAVGAGSADIYGRGGLQYGYRLSFIGYS